MRARFPESYDSGMQEEVMKCESCSAQIEYRFLKNCTYCDSEIVQTESSQNDVISTVQLIEPVKKMSRWVKGVINVGYVLVTSIAGMISGAVAIYALAAITYPAFFRPSGDPSLDCSRGTAIGFLSIVVGAYLGTVGGSVFAVKRPPFQAAE
jgi:hypothetical protein